MNNTNRTFSDAIASAALTILDHQQQPHEHDEDCACIYQIAHILMAFLIGMVLR